MKIPKHVSLIPSYWGYPGWNVLKSCKFAETADKLEFCLSLKYCLEMKSSKIFPTLLMNTKEIKLHAMKTITHENKVDYESHS